MSLIVKNQFNDCILEEVTNGFIRIHLSTLIYLNDHILRASLKCIKINPTLWISF